MDRKVPRKCDDAGCRPCTSDATGVDASYVRGLNAAARVVDRFMDGLSGVMDRGVAYAIAVEIRKTAYDAEQRTEGAQPFAVGSVVKLAKSGLWPGLKEGT